jgi:threonine dehydratase
MPPTESAAARTPLEPAPPELVPRRDVFLKREDVHELGAFKWRGALPVLAEHRNRGAATVITASTGNHGAATAWAALELGLRAIVFVPRGASETKLARIRELGGELEVKGADLDGAKEHALAAAKRLGAPFFEDGAEPAQYDGYAAIGRELLDQLGTPPAAVVVPVGNGALLIGLARALAQAAPETARIGVVAAAAPVMARSWRAGEALTDPRSATIADGMAVRVAIPRAVELLRELATAMVEVSEAELAAAVAAYASVGLRVEAAGAASLAALPHVEADGPVVLLVTGRNIDDDLYERIVGGQSGRSRSALQ